MPKKVSITGVITAVLMGCGAVLLCARLFALPTQMKMEQGPALLIELSCYGVAVILANRRSTLLGYLIGVPVMLALRVVVMAGTAAWHAGQSGAPIVTTGVRVFSSAPVWIAATAFAVLMFLPFAGLLPERLARRRRPRVRESAAGLAAVQAMPELMSRQAEPEAPAEEEDLPGFAALVHLARRETREIAGSVSIPVEHILSQLPESLLPAGGARGEEAAIVPLSAILPQLEEGVVRLPITALAGYMPAGSLREDRDIFAEDEAPMVTLPLEVIVPQLPESVLTVEPANPPSWLRVDPELERTLFARA